MFCYGKKISADRNEVARPIMHNSGFSLMEMMVVVVIAAILAAITFPIYSQHITKKKRLQAELTLQRVSSALEEHYVVKYTYKHFALRDFGIADTLKKSQYHIVIHANNKHFSVAAVPFGSQAKHDIACGTISMNDMGEKNISGSGSSDQCWVG